jgi:hypothetical protein
MNSPPVASFLPVVRILESLGIPYLIGGSIASSIHGAFRSTIDCAILASLSTDHITVLARQLGDQYYLDKDAARDAVVARDSFNVIDKSTMLKIDFFILLETGVV